MKSLRYYFHKVGLWTGLIDKTQQLDLATSVLNRLNGVSEYPYSNYHEWFDASRKGDSKKIEDLLKAGGKNMEKAMSDAVFLTALNGHVKTLKILLDAGADIHASNDHALRVAKKKGHKEIVKILKQHIANEQKRNSESSHEPTL